MGKIEKILRDFGKKWEEAEQSFTIAETEKKRERLLKRIIKKMGVK